MPEQSNTGKNIQKADYKPCSLCLGVGMVSRTDGYRIKCPACSAVSFGSAIINNPEVVEKAVVDKEEAEEAEEVSQSVTDLYKVAEEEMAKAEDEVKHETEEAESTGYKLSPVEQAVVDYKASMILNDKELPTTQDCWDVGFKMFVSSEEYKQCLKEQSMKLLIKEREQKETKPARKPRGSQKGGWKKVYGKKK